MIFKVSTCRVFYHHWYKLIYLALVSLIPVLYMKGITSVISSICWHDSHGNSNVSEAIYKDSQNISLSALSHHEYISGVPDGPRFQRIDSHEAWVFSAFHDTIESQTLIRVFGIQRVDLEEPVLCYIIDKISAFVVEGERTFLVDYHGNRFRVVSYECEIDPNDRPDSVSLTFSETDTPINNVKVVYASPQVRNFTVCYAILFNFTDHLQIIQSVELNKILGARHFFVYNMSISDSADKVLRHYQNQGLLTVIQWPIPVSEIHYQGQVLAINDCVYRNKGESKYVVIQDTDEFILPYQHENWNDLLERINADYDSENSNKHQSHKNLGTYIVESTFFQELPNFYEWMGIKHNYSISEEEQDFFLKYSLTVLTHLKRLNSTFGQARQKSFVRPELVLFPDVHTTMTHRPLATDVKVNKSLALVHHHRFWEPSAIYILETTALRFKDRLVRLVKNTLNIMLAHGLSDTNSILP